MTLIEALISGIVQGFTEFLPISSSGHLVFVHAIFGSKDPSMFFDICLHAATLIAVLVFFRKDILDLIRDRNVKWLSYISVATIPAVIVGVLLEDRIELFFQDPRKVCCMLIITAILLFVGQFALARGKNEGRLSMGRSILVGIAQSIALIPGVSRSGATISAGIAGGLKAEEAFRFSFLLSVPIIIAAVIYKTVTMDAAEASSIDLTVYLVGMSGAFLTGLGALSILKKVIAAKKLYFFGIYCLLLGLAGMLFLK